MRTDMPSVGVSGNRGQFIRDFTLTGSECAMVRAQLIVIEADAAQKRVGVSAPESRTRLTLARPRAIARAHSRDTRGCCPMLGYFNDESAGGQYELVDSRHANRAPLATSFDALGRC